MEWDTGNVHPYPTGVLGRFYLAVHPLVIATDVKTAGTNETRAHAPITDSIPTTPSGEAAPGSESSNKAKSKKDKSVKRSGDAKVSEQQTQDIPSSDKKRKNTKDISITISSSNSSS